MVPISCIPPFLPRITIITDISQGISRGIENITIAVGCDGDYYAQLKRLHQQPYHVKKFSSAVKRLTAALLEVNCCIIGGCKFQHHTMQYWFWNLDILMKVWADILWIPITFTTIQLEFTTKLHLGCPNQINAIPCVLAMVHKLCIGTCTTVHSVCRLL